MISGKGRGFICINVCGVGVRFTDYISLFLNIPRKCNNLRPNYFIFIGYLKTGGHEGGPNEPPELPLDRPLRMDRSCSHWGLKYIVHSPILALDSLALHMT